MISFQVLIEEYDPDPPEPHEIDAAQVLTRHFQSNIRFIPKTTGHCPDVVVERTGEIWEIKSPKGNGKYTMANNLERAHSQSKKVVLDLSRCKMRDERALARIRAYINSKYYQLERVLVVTKMKKVVDMK